MLTIFGMQNIFFKLRMFPGIKFFVRKIIFVFSELFYINAMHN